MKPYAIKTVHYQGKGGLMGYIGYIYIQHKRASHNSSLPLSVNGVVVLYVHRIYNSIVHDSSIIAGLLTLGVSVDN